MKKMKIITVFFISLFLLTSCYTSTFNKLGREEMLYYESEDETIRLEIVTKTSPYGKLYILEDNVQHFYIVEYFIVKEDLIVYDSSYFTNGSKYSLDVSFQHINYFKSDYDVMYLKNNNVDQSGHGLLSNLDVKLIRNKTKKVSLLNYYYVRWYDESSKLTFENNELSNYYSNIYKGIYNEEEVTISFIDDSFLIRNHDLVIILSGSFYFEEESIILEQFGWYENFPELITLQLEKIE